MRRSCQGVGRFRTTSSVFPELRLGGARGPCAFAWLGPGYRTRYVPYHHYGRLAGERGSTNNTVNTRRSTDGQQDLPPSEV